LITNGVGRSNPAPFFFSDASGLVLAYAATPGIAILATLEQILMMRRPVLRAAGSLADKKRDFRVRVEYFIKDFFRGALDGRI
jgi:hypothetical protein